MRGSSGWLVLNTQGRDSISPSNVGYLLHLKEIHIWPVFLTMRMWGASFGEIIKIDCSTCWCINILAKCGTWRVSSSAQSSLRNKKEIKNYEYEIGTSKRGVRYIYGSELTAYFWRGLEDGRKMRADKRGQRDDETIYRRIFVSNYIFASSVAICDPSESNSITARLYQAVEVFFDATRTRFLRILFLRAVFTSYFFGFCSLSSSGRSMALLFPVIWRCWSPERDRTKVTYTRGLPFLQLGSHFTYSLLFLEVKHSCCISR